MKKLILAACALGYAVSVFGQGEIILYNQTSTVKTRVYLGGTAQLFGNGANDLPVGATDWTGFTGLNGAGYTAQLWAANGINQAESSLVGLSPTTTFLTVAAGAGVMINAGAVVVPGTPENGQATMALRVWDNKGGTITSWNAAVAAGGVYGESPLFNSPPLGLTTTPVPSLVGLQSFNVFPHVVPEPSTFALAGLGAAALLIFRRRK